MYMIEYSELVVMKFKNIPKALALIPDGNRRWARNNQMSFLKGYELGVSKFIDFSEWCNSYGVNNISVWAFSSENIKRPKEELNALFRIYDKAAEDKDLISRLHENKIRFKVVGDTSLLPKTLVSKLRVIEKQTGVYGRKVINMLIGYGGKEDILYAAKKLAKKSIDKGRVVVNENAFRSELMSNAIPDIDFLIRTSGEERLSGFMPWQTSYSELYFSEKLWPDFMKADLSKALLAFDARQRRFGV